MTTETTELSKLLRKDTEALLGEAYQRIQTADLSQALEDILRYESRLLILTVQGIDIQKDLAHLKARFANLIASKAIVNLKQGEAIFDTVLSKIVTTAIKSLASLA
jgi:hypothetical protein